MQIGKIDNASASHIDPTAQAMRAPAESASQGKVGVTSLPAQSQAEDKPNTAAELLESKDVYKLDISEEGQALAAMEKKTLADNKADNKNVELVVSGEDGDMTVSVPKDGEIINVVIEILIDDIFKSSELHKDGNGAWLYDNLQDLGRALNAYGNKQREDIANGSDRYLQNLSDRLDMMDERNPIVQRIRDMLNYTMSGRDIDVWSDKFQEEAYKTWEEYQTYIGQSPEEETKSKDVFDGKFALYSYMQKLARWQAERDAELIEEMTGEGDEKKENYGADEILRDMLLEEGLQTINEKVFAIIKEAITEET